MVIPRNLRLPWPRKHPILVVRSNHEASPVGGSMELMMWGAAAIGLILVWSTGAVLIWKLQQRNFAFGSLSLAFAAVWPLAVPLSILIGLVGWWADGDDEGDSDKQ